MHLAPLRALSPGRSHSIRTTSPGGGILTLTRVVRNLIVLGVFAVLAMPTAAFASANDVLRDCIQDGKLDRTYSNEELRKAKDNLPADSDEYSDCSDVIASAIKGGSGQGSGAGSPGVGGTDPAGEAAARTEDQGELARSRAASDAPSVDVGGASLEPDSSGFFNLAGAANEVPLPLCVRADPARPVRVRERPGGHARARARAGADSPPVQDPDPACPVLPASPLAQSR